MSTDTGNIDAIIAKFLEGLNTKFKGEYSFTAMKGRKFTRIVQENKWGSARRVHCFLDPEGNVLKAAGWAAPAKGIRFVMTEDTVENVIAVADMYGSYLYIR